MFVNGWNFVVQVYYIPTFYQLAYGYSAVRSGALLLPLVLIQSTHDLFFAAKHRQILMLSFSVTSLEQHLFRANRNLDRPLPRMSIPH